jgi:hypothetical protein
MSDYLSDNFPSKDYTDGEFLFKNLGTFWTQLFQDSETLRGYTLGMAEELIQSYLNLIEIINKYSIKDIDIYHREKWYPLIIRKSLFNGVPFVFEPDAAVFGPQPTEDRLYSEKVFRFGFPKESVENTLYTYDLTNDKVKKIGLISNKIINPTQILIPGVDYFLKNNILYFNSNIFENKKFNSVKLLGNLGEKVTYLHNNVLLEDEIIVLWLYNTEIDNDDLYLNFGKLYDIKFNSSVWYKEFLKSFTNLRIESATIKALKLICAAIIDVPLILENNETVEDIYKDDKYSYVITNKNVYKLTLNQNISEAIQIGKTLHAGEFITDNILLLDSLILNNWWKTSIKTNKLAFPSHVFLINPEKQLLFSNDIELVYYIKGVLTFPILGQSEDVLSFQNYINLPKNKLDLLKALNLFENTPKIIDNEETIVDIVYSAEQDIFITTDKNYYRINRNRNISKEVIIGKTLSKNTPIILMDSFENINNFTTINAPIAINPLDFVFKNIFKNNTVFLKISFTNDTQLKSFFNLINILKPYLPSHVYFLIHINLNFTEEIFDNLNKSLVIPDFKKVLFSSDGSISSLKNISECKTPRVGGRPELLNSDAMYYKDYINRLFCVSLGPYKNNLPLHADENLENLAIDNTELRNNSPGIKCGLLRTEIPTTYTPAGESEARKPSTKEIQSILLIDF